MSINKVGGTKQIASSPICLVKKMAWSKNPSAANMLVKSSGGNSCRFTSTASVDAPNQTEAPQSLAIETTDVI